MKTDVQMYISLKALIERGGEVLVLVDPQEGLDFPGGKMQQGETVVQSLQREVREEVALEVSVEKPFYTNISVFPEGHEFSGKQSFVVAYTCNYVSDEVLLSNEHSSYKWVNKDTYKTVDDESWFFEILKVYFG